MKRKKGSQFLRFFIPIIEVLKELGGSGRPAEVIDLVIEKLCIPEKEQEETLKSGASRIRNQVQFARLYLVKSGFLDSSQWGVWSLTEKGLKSNLDDKDVTKFYKEVQSQKRTNQNINRDFKTAVSTSDQIETEALENEDYRIELLNLLKTLPPDGFERICQRLLRESGFQQVIVTGRSGDGGIDGHGIFQVNPFLSFKVLFQCKRYEGNVSASKVRDFRGAMQGRADKGIIITTGKFTKDAREEAIRPGVPPIELVDGEIVAEMFAKLELGLSPKTIYEVDYDFFNQYK